MKKKQKEELKGKTIQELMSEIARLEKEIQQLKIDISLGKIKNTTQLVRKLDDLAIIKTLLREKQLLENLKKEN